MDKNELQKFSTLSFKVRENVLKMAANGGCFLGSAFSCADLLVYLYSGFMRIDLDNLKNPGRDYFFLSKGHSVPALYALFAELGFINPERLKSHLRLSDDIYWHPNRGIPGIEFHSGSLGHLLSVGVGVAIDCKLNKTTNRIIILTGDGELNEGSNWEALLTAQAYKLDNLIVIVDRNNIQANCRTEDLIPIEPLEQKFISFGCATEVIDGHDFIEMEEVFSRLPFLEDQPNLIIANTARGKGLPNLENRIDKWFCNFNKSEYDEHLLQLYAVNGEMFV